MDGAKWQHVVRQFVAQVHLADGQASPDLVRHHQRTEALSLAWLLDVLGSLRRKGARIVAQGPELYQASVARRFRVHPRTVQRRARAARAVGLLGGWEVVTDRGKRTTSQPPPGSPDATGRGEFSYAEWWATMALPAVLLRRLRIWWGEVKPHTPSRAPAAQAKPTSAAPDPERPERPPSAPPEVAPAALPPWEALTGQALQRFLREQAEAAGRL
jgi:hypothetical protein